mgnify:CR=1 FL=1
MEFLTNGRGCGAGVRVGSKGHAACVNVRLIHALARKLCLMSPEWSQGHTALVPPRQSCVCVCVCLCQLTMKSRVLQSEVDSDGRQLSEQEM